MNNYYMIMTNVQCGKKSNWNIVEKEVNSKPLVTSIDEQWWIKLVLWDQTSPPSDMMWSCKCFPHASIMLIISSATYPPVFLYEATYPPRILIRCNISPRILIGCNLFPRIFLRCNLFPHILIRCNLFPRILIRSNLFPRILIRCNIFPVSL
jgi:hypothetical protein